MPSHRSRPIGNADISGHRILASRSTIRQADSRDRPEPRTGGMGSVPSISDPGRSRNVRTQFTPDDARRFYDRFGSRQDTQGFYENPALDDLVKHADFEHARSVLEFGCGTGSFARRLFETVLPADARYLGLDISGTMIGLATRRLEPWQDRTEVRQTDGTPCLPVPDTSFDRFLATYVFRPARPCVFLPLDRRGTPGSDPRWSPLHSQPDPRDGSVFSVRFLALVFHLRPLAQARRGLPPDPFGRASGTGKMANPAPLGGGLFRAEAVREMSLATSLSACRASILSMAVFLTSCRVSASSPHNPT